MKKNETFSVVGMIAEYNPFHNGHAYHMAKAKEMTGADYCVVVMSGDFVQRGEPAIYDKYIRTAMALRAGADLVVEMPSVFATSSAEDFAGCGTALLDGLGVVTHLCFGSECGDVGSMYRIAKLLAREPEDYVGLLKEKLRKGENFPAARQAALAECLEGRRDVDPVEVQILNSPNNILGIEYCKALIRLDSSITPITISRAGSGYHDVEFADGFASATGIRQLLRQVWQPDPAVQMEQKKQTFQTGNWMAELECQVPGEVLTLIKKNSPLFPGDFSAFLNTTLLQMVHNGERLIDYADVSEELEARLRSSLLEFCSFEERIMQLKTKQYTYTRISRALLHLMLGIKKTDIEGGRALNYAPYARVLGFRKGSAGLLTEIKNRGQIPLVTKTADAGQILTPDAYKMLQQDFTCSHLYSAVWNGRYGRPVLNEFSRQIVIL